VKDAASDAWDATCDTVSDFAEDTVNAVKEVGTFVVEHPVEVAVTAAAITATALTGGAAPAIFVAGASLVGGGVYAACSDGDKKDAFATGMAITSSALSVFYMGATYLLGGGAAAGAAELETGTLTYWANYVNEAQTTYDATKLVQTQPYIYEQEVSDLMEYIGNNGTENIPPILVRVHDGVAYIVDGHHRFNALLRLGYDRIPIKYLHSSDLGKTLSDGTFIRTIEDIIAGSHLCE
jgi:hypothetical protein